jgi:AcrR family transcriptional regulator
METNDTRRSAAPPTPANEATYERIVDACEALIRRHGPAKATVVDVARALGMSHANVYRHFASKAALREVVVERFLDVISEPLERIVASSAPAPERLAAWLRTLSAAKRGRALADPELFAAYRTLAEEQEGAVRRHVTKLTGQLAAIVEDGVRAGEFASADPAATAWALFDGTAAFHHPHQVLKSAGDPSVERRLETLIAILVAGLRPDAPRG